MNAVAFSSSTGLANHYPEVPPEMRSSINAMGFPSVLLSLHQSLKSAINRIPKANSAGKPMREQFLRCVGMNLASQAEVEKFCNMLGFESAVYDLRAKRISEMTVVDFIVDPDLATPDAAAVKSALSTVVGPDNARFSRVPVKEGQQNNEWGEMERDDAPGL